MDAPFQYNSATVNINTDATLVAILSRFSSDYIMDVINNSIDNKFRPYGDPAPNIVYGYEEQFKYLTDGFSSNVDQIAVTRRDTYLDIINTLCERYGLTFNYSDDIDLYSAAFYLYDFLVSNFTRYIITFFTNYLVQERDQIYKAFDLQNMEASIPYSKKLFKNHEIASIHGHLGTILNGMQSFDIDLWTILDMVYADKNVARYIYGLVTDKTNFFQTNYLTYALDPHINPELQIGIKLQMQNMYGEMYSIDSFTEKK